MMNGGPCPNCSAQPQPCCRCGEMPSNLAFLRKVLNKPQNTRRCRHRRPRCFTLAAGGDSVDCLCCFDENLAASSDRRLETWQRELQLRNNIAERLMQRTGKAFCELLFNRSVTVDGRDKSMTQRLLAHAESASPKASQKKAVFMNCFPDGCCTMGLMSAQPTKERYFEVSGLPAGVKCELIGENCCVRRSGWVTSKAVQHSIAAKGRDIRRVLPFFPDIEYLQIIGRKMRLCEKPVDFDEYACWDEVVYPENADEACTLESCPAYMNVQTGEVVENVGVAAEEQVLEVKEAEEPIVDAKETVEPEEAKEDIEIAEAAEVNKLPCHCALAIADEDAISCSNISIDFYRELLVNRAKCHDVFYRP